MKYPQSTAAVQRISNEKLLYFHRQGPQLICSLRRKVSQKKFAINFKIALNLDIITDGIVLKVYP